ncbi:MAG TPA: SE1832 family protein [Pseudogracilibacillus sp.]|nr:SE1832 family protein [Pseudogracilibacillus sp.]
MDKKQLEAKLAELKSDYVRIQGDLEKVVSVGGQEQPPERELIRLEKEIAEINEQLEKLSQQE